MISDRLFALSLAGHVAATRWVREAKEIAREREREPVARLSIYLSIYLSVCLSICLSICLCSWYAGPPAG
jgi:hypothetical protein